MDFCRDISVNDSCMCNLSLDLNECIWTPRTQYSIYLTVFATICYVVIFVVATVWNGFVIAIFAKDRYLLQEPSSLFLLILTIVDLLEALFSIPFYVASSVGGGWIIGDTDRVRNGTCVAIAFVFSMFLFCTAHLLAVISFDRFLYIVYPFKYKKWVSVPRSLALALVILLIPLILTCLPLFGFGRLGYSPFVDACTFRWEGETDYLILIVLEVMIPIIATGVFTVWTFVHVKRFIRRRHVRQKSINMSTELNKSVDRSLTRTFVLLLISQVGCFAPGLMTAVIGIAIGLENVPVEVYVIAFVIILSSVAINPVIQSTSRTRIRHYLSTLLLVLSCRKSHGKKSAEQSDEGQDTRTNNMTMGTGVSPYNNGSVYPSIDYTAEPVVGVCAHTGYDSNHHSPGRILKKYSMDPINGTLV